MDEGCRGVCIVIFVRAGLGGFAWGSCDAMGWVGFLPEAAIWFGFGVRLGDSDISNFLDFGRASHCLYSYFATFMSRHIDTGSRSRICCRRNYVVFEPARGRYTVLMYSKRSGPI